MKSKSNSPPAAADFEEDVIIDVESVDDNNVTVIKKDRTKKRRERPKVKCIHCGYATRNAEHMNEHVMHFHLAVKTLQCNHCTFKTVSEKLLSRHKLLKHRREENKNEKLKCHYCTFATKSEAVLKRHGLFMHCRSCPWTCSLCTFAATNVQELYYHVFNSHHATKKRYVCGFCGFRAATKGNIKIHIIRKHLTSMNAKKKKSATALKEK